MVLQCSNFYFVLYSASNQSIVVPIKCENHGSILQSTGLIMIAYYTSFSLIQLPAFELGICLRENLSAAAATSVAGIEYFTSSSHVP